MGAEGREGKGGGKQGMVMTGLTDTLCYNVLCGGVVWHAARSGCGKICCAVLCCVAMLELWDGRLLWKALSSERYSHRYTNHVLDDYTPPAPVIARDMMTTRCMVHDSVTHDDYTLHGA